MGTRKRSQAGAEAARDSQRPRGDFTPSARPAAHVSRPIATPRTRSAHAPTALATASAAPPHSTNASTPALRSHTPGMRLGSTREQQAHQRARAMRGAPKAAPPLTGQPGATAGQVQTRLTLRAGPATDSGRRHFGELRAALDEGWEIVQPIFARPLWSAADDSATAFNFVLHGPHGTRLITVPQGALVERFIRDRHLSVDHAR